MKSNHLPLPDESKEPISHRKQNKVTKTSLPESITNHRNIQEQSETTMVLSGRERLKRHREEVAGKILIPESWGKEGLLKGWMDFSAFDAAFTSSQIVSARAALMADAGDDVGARGSRTQRLRGISGETLCLITRGSTTNSYIRILTNGELKSPRQSCSMRYIIGTVVRMEMLQDINNDVYEEDLCHVRFELLDARKEAVVICIAQGRLVWQFVSVYERNKSESAVCVMRFWRISNGKGVDENSVVLRSHFPCSEFKFDPQNGVVCEFKDMRRGLHG